MKQAAVLYRLQTLAESTQRLSDSIKEGHPEIDWEAIRGLRNRITHDYLGVNLTIVWDIIENYLLDLHRVVAKLLDETPDNNP